MISATILATYDRQLPLPLANTPTFLPPTPTGSADPQFTARIGRFMQAIAEAINGQRPVRQLGGWLTADVFDQLQLSITSGQLPRGQTRVRSVHVSMVEPHIAEVASRVERNDRSTAIAARLERAEDVRGRHVWRCTALCWA